MLWDWYGYPTPLVTMWNVLNHHIGISEEVGLVRPPGANFAIFQDLRNNRGVTIAYADREAKEDAVVALPDFGAPLTMEDAMGNAGPAGKTLTLSKSGRPVILYAATGIAGKIFSAKLAPLDRKNAGFVVKATHGKSPVWKLPPVWEGKTKGESEGSVALADGKPVWKLEQLWPDEWKKRENFRAMVWNGTEWNVKDGGFGGQPGASFKDGVLNFGTRAPHGMNNDLHLRTAGLTFVAPQTGPYEAHGIASAHMWDSQNKTTLYFLKKSGANVLEAGAIEVPNGGETSLEGQRFDLAAGDELTFLPRIDGNFAGGDLKLTDFALSLGGPKADAGGVYKLPAAWAGREKGSAAGNPFLANGQPAWRLDRLFPGDAILAANYAPLVWGGGEWIAPDHSQGGQPDARVEGGKAILEARGPWDGNEFGFPKIPVLSFIAPKNGIYVVTASASSKPWEGGAASIPLTLRKKDTQRAAEVTVAQLPRDGSAVAISARLEMAAGTELLFVPMMQDLHNNATKVTIENLAIRAE